MDRRRIPADNPSGSIGNHPMLQVIKNTGDFVWLGGRDSAPKTGEQREPVCAGSQADQTTSERE
jgi:hypothetical protein